MHELLAESIRPPTSREGDHSEEGAGLAQHAAEVMLHRQVAHLAGHLLRRIEVALIPVQQPARDKSLSQLDVGTLAVRGLAWSGVAPIARVEVSVNGSDWLPVRLLGQPSRYSWQPWELITRVDRPGRAKVRARATDTAGRQQPDQVEWNRLGYGNNAVQEIAILAK